MKFNKFQNGRKWNILFYHSWVMQNWKRFYVAFISHGIFYSKMLLTNASLKKTEKNGKKRIKVPLQNGKRVTVYESTYEWVVFLTSEHRKDRSTRGSFCMEIEMLFSEFNR